ncbi:MAG: hypothetical protein KY459_15395 [Acidobacteria bacterium]|nr:hypothetical protein [Acidobacteriota bacterium]
MMNLLSSFCTTTGLTHEGPGNRHLWRKNRNPVKIATDPVVIEGEMVAEYQAFYGFGGA